MPILKMLTGLCGPDYSLVRGDEHEFDEREASSLIRAGFAEATDGFVPIPLQDEDGENDTPVIDAAAADAAAKAEAEAAEVKAAEEAAAAEKAKADEEAAAKANAEAAAKAAAAATPPAAKPAAAKRKG